MLNIQQNTLPTSMPDTCENSISITVVDNFDEWQTMKDEWNRLVEQSISPSIFLTYQFLSAEWTALSQHNFLHILIIKQGDHLLGIAPLKIVLRRVCGILTRTIEPIASLIAEKDFFIVLKEEELFYKALVDYFYNNKELWHKLYFSMLPDDHLFLSALKQKFASCKNIILEDEHNLTHTCINISGDWQEYWSSLKPKFTKKIQNSFKKLCEIGEPHIIRINNHDKIMAYLNLYLKIEEHSWKDQMKSGITCTIDLFNTYQAILEACTNNGAEITFLTIGNQIMAGGIHITYNGEFNYLQTVYDQNFSQLNAGTILMTINIWRAFSEKLKRVHFMGNYEDYKRNWANYEWQSRTICARAKYSGEGLSYFGSSWFKEPIAQIFKHSEHEHQKVVPTEQLAPPLTIDLSKLAKEDLILDMKDLKEIFFKSENEPEPTQDKPSDGKLISKEEIEGLINERNHARQEHTWKRADEIRDYLKQHGITIQDTAQGTTYEYQAGSPTHRS